MGQFGSSPTNRWYDRDVLQPTVAEVRGIAAALVREKRLPIELAVEILRLADITPEMRAASSKEHEVHAGVSGNRQRVAILETPDIPVIPGIAPEDSVLSITTHTQSHDQGFSSTPQFHNTHEASHSWFELALIRPKPPPPPEPKKESTTLEAAKTHAAPSALDRYGASLRPPEPREFQLVVRAYMFPNVHASLKFTEVTCKLEKRKPRDRTTLSAAGKTADEEEAEEDEQDRAQRIMMEQIRPGDRLVLYALAQYPAWSNFVRAAQIDIRMRAL